MTTTLTVTPAALAGPFPDAIDIALAARRISARTLGSPAARTCAGLAAVLDELANQHAGCEAPHCRTCLQLRTGLAYLEALYRGDI